MIKKTNVTFTAKFWHITFCLYSIWIFKSVPQKYCVKIKLLYFSLHMNYLI